MLDKNTPRAEELTNAIARMIVLDFQPFSLLSDKDFRELLQVADLRFHIPNRTTFSQDIIPAMYVKEKKKVEDTIHSDVTTISKICIILVMVISISRSIRVIVLKSVLRYLSNRI